MNDIIVALITGGVTLAGVFNVHRHRNIVENKPMYIETNEIK